MSAVVGLVALYAMRGVRWLSLWSGLPALVVSALAVVVGWRLLRKTLRLLVEVALVSAALFAATELGWIKW